MAQSPTKQSKIQMREKRKKIQAFKSFLQKPEPNSGSKLQLSNNASDHQQSSLIEQEHEQRMCIVCSVQLGERKRFCGFCRNVACNQHMRKKRKSKNSNNKFVRICDNCEDKYLYRKYMKLQLKNQESISAQESIVTAKKLQIQQQLNGRKTKLQLLYNKQNQLLNEEKTNNNKYITSINQLNSKEEKCRNKQIQLQKMQAQLDELQQKLPPSLEQDYQVLEIQNQKVVKELVRYERLCNEAMKAKSKREKQIYQEYNQWQQKQRMLKKKKNEEDCIIF